MKKPPDSAVILAAGVLGLFALGEELVPDERKPHWFDQPHSHVEFPEGTTGNSSQISWDSGAKVNTNATPAGSSYSSYPYVSIVGRK
jgi:hypothetical protein